MVVQHYASAVMSGAGGFQTNLGDTAVTGDTLGVTLGTSDIPSHGGLLVDYAIKPAVQASVRKLANGTWDWIGSHIPSWDSAVALAHQFGRVLAEEWRWGEQAFAEFCHWLSQWLG